jgi:hypothetical protein
MEPETAAFGYPRERLFLRTAGRWRPLAIRDMRRVYYRRAAVSPF